MVSLGHPTPFEMGPYNENLLRANVRNYSHKTKQKGETRNFLTLKAI